MRILKSILIGLGVIVAAAALALTYGIPAGFLVDTIQRRFESETGHRLRIAGDTKIGLWPSPGMTLGDVAIFDGGDPNSPMKAESVRLAVPFSSLFASRPQVSEIALVRPVVRVPVTRQRATAPASRPAARTERRPDTSRSFTIDRFVVEDGTLLMVSAGGRIESRIERIKIEGSLDADDAFVVKASGQAGGEALRLEVKGTAPGGRFDGAPAPIEFVIEAPGVFADPLPGSAQIRLSGTALNINGLSGSFGKNQFNGWALVDFSGKPLVKVDLDFPRVEVVAAPPPAASHDAAVAPAALDQPWSDRAFDLDGLNFFDADVQFSAAQFSIDKFRFAPIVVKANLADGVVRAVFTDVGVYGGRVQGGLTIDASGPPRHALRLDLNGVQAFPLLSDVAGFDAIDGRMQAKIDVRARGASQRAAMSTLEGSVEVSVADGEIRNVNIAEMIRSLTSTTLNGWQRERAAKTDLSELSARFRIVDGKAATDNLHLAGPLVRVSGAGAVDLGAKTLQFKLDPRLVMSLEGQGGAANPLGFGVPVMMQGPWSQPRIHLDMAGMLDNPDAAYDRLRELGGGLFGSGAGKGLMQGLGNILDNLGRDRREPQTPAAGGGAPQAAPAQPQSPSQSQSPPQPQSKPQEPDHNPLRDILRDLFSR